MRTEDTLRADSAHILRGDLPAVQHVAPSAGNAGRVLRKRRYGMLFNQCAINNFNGLAFAGSLSAEYTSTAEMRSSKRGMSSPFLLPGCMRILTPSAARQNPVHNERSESPGAQSSGCLSELTSDTDDRGAYSDVCRACHAHINIILSLEDDDDDASDVSAEIVASLLLQPQPDEQDERQGRTPEGSSLLGSTSRSPVRPLHSDEEIAGDTEVTPVTVGPSTQATPNRPAANADMPADDNSFRPFPRSIANALAHDANLALDFGSDADFSGVPPRQIPTVTHHLTLLSLAHESWKRARSDAESSIRIYDEATEKLKVLNGKYKDFMAQLVQRPLADRDHIDA